MSKQAEDTPTCALCGHVQAELLNLANQDASCCRTCAAQLGKLLASQPERLLSFWPQLHEDDASEPEPRVRLSDGSSVELRHHTERLKEELSLPQRLELAETLGQLRLEREQFLECAFVLKNGSDPELVQKALDVLFERCRRRREVIPLLRESLYPC